MRVRSLLSHDTSRGSDLPELRPEVPGPFPAPVPLHRRVHSRPARVRDGSALCGHSLGAAGDWPWETCSVSASCGEGQCLV